VLPELISLGVLFRLEDNFFLLNNGLSLLKGTLANAPGLKPAGQVTAPHPPKIRTKERGLK